MFRSAVLAFSLAVFPIVSHAAFYDGKDLLEFSGSYARLLDAKPSPMDNATFQRFMGYVVGVADSTSGLGIYCMKSGTDVRQILAIVHKYVGNNPEQWGDKADLIVVRAFVAAFPCAKK